MFNLFKKIREKKLKKYKLTEEELKAMGITYTKINRIELDRVKPNINHVSYNTIKRV